MAKIAVLGYGTVGSGVVEVLNTNGASIAKRAGDTIEVKSVLDLRDFPGDPIQDKIVHDIVLIINDPEIEVVVEVMGGVEPAFTFVKKALEAGKSVCTSNKALVAAHGPELLEMAKERKLNFMFEASVGGGIPIIRPLNQSLTADEITKITGILRGILKSGLIVSDHFKLADVDARCEESHCYSISDKSLAVGGGVLEAVTAWDYERNQDGNDL